MTRLRFYVGGRGQASGSAHILLVTTFGGYTLTPTTGAWRAPDGKVHCERSRVYEVLADNADQILAISMAAAEAGSLLERHVRLIGNLQDVAGVDPDVEGLPSKQELDRRRLVGLGARRAAEDRAPTRGVLRRPGDLEWPVDVNFPDARQPHVVVRVLLGEAPTAERLLR